MSNSIDNPSITCATDVELQKMLQRPTYTAFYKRCINEEILKRELRSQRHVHNLRTVGRMAVFS
jgi:hypothetical protein